MDGKAKSPSANSDDLLSAPDRAAGARLGRRRSRQPFQGRQKGLKMRSKKNSNTSQTCSQMELFRGGDLWNLWGPAAVLIDKALSEISRLRPRDRQVVLSTIQRDLRVASAKVSDIVVTTAEEVGSVDRTTSKGCRRREKHAKR